MYNNVESKAKAGVSLGLEKIHIVPLKNWTSAEECKGGEEWQSCLCKGTYPSFSSTISLLSKNEAFMQDLRNFEFGFQEGC